MEMVVEQRTVFPIRFAPDIDKIHITLSLALTTWAMSCGKRSNLIKQE
jgi:hypothetical protein